MTWSWTRILEAGLIAVVTAVLTSLATVRVLDERTVTLKEDIQNVRAAMALLDSREQRHHDSVQESLRQIYTLLVRSRGS